MSRRSKYNVDNSPEGRERRCVDNIVFASQREAKVYANFIRPNVRAGIFRDLEMQKRFALYAAVAMPDTANRIVDCPSSAAVVAHYVADFVVVDKDGATHVFDAKGAQTAAYKLKKKIFEANYGRRIEEL